MDELATRGDGCGMQQERKASRALFIYSSGTHYLDLTNPVFEIWYNKLAFVFPYISGSNLGASSSPSEPQRERRGRDAEDLGRPVPGGVRPGAATEARQATPARHQEAQAGLVRSEYYILVHYSRPEQHRSKCRITDPFFLCVLFLLGKSSFITTLWMRG